MTAKRLQPIPPGEILYDEFMKPLGVSINALAREINVPPNRISVGNWGQTTFLPMQSEMEGRRQRQRVRGSCAHARKTCTLSAGCWKVSSGTALVTYRGRRPVVVQLSIVNPFTRTNSVVLFVTSVRPRLRACAAMNRSLAPMRAPRFFRSARIPA